ncbi:hypothetical protein U0070_005642 [Myodes glareolus]|uniref:Uncharacterized protein n=1 Tax=Myodes glareolus TaxID=447135 RepID=A0AAW0IM53_MYOGA
MSALKDSLRCVFYTRSSQEEGLSFQWAALNELNGLQNSNNRRHEGLAFSSLVYGVFIPWRPMWGLRTPWRLEERHCTRRTGLSTHLDHCGQWAKHRSSKNHHGKPDHETDSRGFNSDARQVKQTEYTIGKQTEYCLVGGFTLAP